MEGSNKTQRPAPFLRGTFVRDYGKLSMIAAKFLFSTYLGSLQKFLSQWKTAGPQSFIDVFRDS